MHARADSADKDGKLSLLLVASALILLSGSTVCSAQQGGYPLVEVEKIFNLDGRTPSAAAWSKDGSLLITTDTLDLRIIVWDYARKIELHRIQKTALGSRWLSWMPDGGNMITSAASFSDLKKNRNSFSLVDIKTGAIVRNIEGPDSDPPHRGRNIARKFAIDATGKFAASITADKDYDYLTLYDCSDWSLRSTRRLTKADGSKLIVSNMAFNPANGHLALLGVDGILQVLKPESFQDALEVRTFSSFANGLAFSPDGKFAITAGGSRATQNPDRERESVRLWETNSWALRAKPNATVEEDLRARSVAFSPDGRYVAALNLDGKVRLLDATSFAQVKEIRDGGDGGVAVVFSPDGKRLAIVRHFDIRVVTLKYSE